METIFETFMLPSGGKIYDKDINPIVDLTSMKVWQEMKRLSPTDMPYKLMSDIIEECLREKLAISVYDLCLGDYQYLLYKLRTVTYGSQYKMNMICPKCGQIAETLVDLDNIAINEYNEDYNNFTHITLPNGDEIDLNYQTPRMLDEISRRAKEMQKKVKSNTDYTLLFTLVLAIKQVNGTKMSNVQLENYCKNLGMKDCNFLIHSIDELNGKIGMSNDILVNCSNCGNDSLVPFRLTSEFFGPTL